MIILHVLSVDIGVLLVVKLDAVVVSPCVWVGCLILRINSGYWVEVAEVRTFIHHGVEDERMFVSVIPGLERESRVA